MLHSHGRRPARFYRSFLDPLFISSPFTDIMITKPGYEIQIDLPGVEKKDIATGSEKGALSAAVIEKAVEPEGTK
jgi:HSP20 family molecular chaperone IbpA